MPQAAAGRRFAEAREGPAAELVLAADQFLITPVGRLENPRLPVPGDGGKTVIAGYHWFTDWGRDTMISLEGLTLKTGRRNDAAKILLTFANYIRDGLIPNMFPEGEREGLPIPPTPHCGSSTPSHRYVQLTNDRETLHKGRNTFTKFLSKKHEINF